MQRDLYVVTMPLPYRKSHQETPFLKKYRPKAFFTKRLIALCSVPSGLEHSRVLLSVLSVGDSNFFQGRDRVWVATQKKYPIANQTRSRPELNDRVEIFWVATRMSIATRSKILDCFHQAVYPGKFSKKFLGRDRNIFLGRERLRVATGIFFGSRPVFRFSVATYGSMVPHTSSKTFSSVSSRQ
jgi:hypothetical protein